MKINLYQTIERLESYSSIVDGKLHLTDKGSKKAFLPISDRLIDSRRKIKRYGNLTDGMFMVSLLKHSERANDVLKKSVGTAGCKNNDATNHKWRLSFAFNLIRSGVGAKQV